MPQVVPDDARPSLVAVAVSVTLVGLLAFFLQRDLPAMASMAPLSDGDVARLETVLDAMALSYGDTVDASDVARAADGLGVDLGATVDVSDVEVLAAARRASAVVATYGPLQLSVPSDHIRLVGFHEASSPTTVGLVPADRPGMTTMSTRNRPTHPRSAVDVAVAPGTPMYAPVTGRVVEVARYRLYGRHPDVRIRIVPDDDPDLVVTMLHLAGPLVAVGDEVAAGDPLAASSRVLPIRSQIDRYAGAGPHLHMEVRPRRPGDEREFTDTVTS